MTDQIPNVFPTGVGVYRVSFPQLPSKVCFPHRRGGVPILTILKYVARVFSPQAWGCTDRVRPVRLA